MTENSASSACHREPARPECIYKPPRDLNVISVLPKSCSVRSLSRERPSSRERRVDSRAALLGVADERRSERCGLLFSPAWLSQA
jgi:hypothetical protein